MVDFHHGGCATNRATPSSKFDYCFSFILFLDLRSKKRTLKYSRPCGFFCSRSLQVSLVFPDKKKNYMRLCLCCTVCKPVFPCILDKERRGEKRSQGDTEINTKQKKKVKRGSTSHRIW